LVSVKDVCAPQGQCGGCTVLVAGDARVACVTPATRVAGRTVTTLEGLGRAQRDALADAFVTTGGSQCGFCTPGILMRATAQLQKAKTSRAELDRALAAHLCRCTGWLTVLDAISASAGVVSPASPVAPARDFTAASRRARLEGGVAQRVGTEIPLGDGGFADDTAPRDAVVAVPANRIGEADTVPAAGLEWVLGESLLDARSRAGIVQGRRTTLDDLPPLPAPTAPQGGVALATSWVEPAYLEPDASWCAPGDAPAGPLANGGAFGGKVASVAPDAARELSSELGRTVRVVLTREAVTRLGPKRPPIAATAVLDGDTVRIDGRFVAPREPADTTEWMRAASASTNPYGVAVDARWEPAPALGPPVSSELRAAGWAEAALLVEAALDAASFDRGAHIDDPLDRAVLLDTCVRHPASGARAGARVAIDGTSARLEHVEVRVAAGDPLDATVLRSYAIGAAHMALGWVLSEGIAVDPTTGEVHDLTIRSFGILRARDVPPIDVAIVADAHAPRARASEAVFAAVGAATWNALACADGARPTAFPARETRTGRALRR
jgi:aerobic-type carbon monoxide dehydrogenase small subunit (CoxS/CutS family)